MVGVPGLVAVLAVAGPSVAARPPGTMGSGLELQLAADPLAATVCAAGATLPGIDVSHWQGDVDWARVAADGIEFALVRASHGVSVIDEWFASNWADSRAQGLYAGVYQYFEPGQDPIAQAEIVLGMMGRLGPEDLPPVIDVETTGDLPPAEVASAVAQWIEHIEAGAGVRPIIYTGRYFWRDYVQSPAFADYPLWIAHYTTDCPNIPDPWSTWTFHQYTSAGAVNGIVGDVDRNRFNGDEQALRGMLAGAQGCGDGLCLGGETTDSCPSDCVPCGVIDPAGSTVDDGDACYQLLGPPEFWRHEAQGEQGDSAWTLATDLGEPSNSAVVDLHFAEAGTYELQAHLVADYAQSTRASYRVTHGAGIEEVVVDQSAQRGWVVLGEFEFAAGSGGQGIVVHDNTGEPASLEIPLGLDAFRLVRIDMPGQGSTGGTGSGTEAEGGDVTDSSDEGDVSEGTSIGVDGTDSTGMVRDTSGDADDEDADSDGGCGCRARGRPGRYMALLPWLAVAGLAACRRRRRS